MKLRKLIPVSVLGIAALGLAGCGVFDSDDDDSPAPAVSMSGMDMPDDDAPDDDAPDVDAGPSAQTLEDARAALAALGEDATDEERATAQKDVDDALRLEGNEAELIASLQEEIDRVNEEAEEVLAKAAKAESIAREAGISAAIELDGVMMVHTDDLTPGEGSDVTAVTAERDAAGMVTIDVNGVAEDEYAGGESDAGDVWTSAMLTRTNVDDSEDVVVIYTDVEAPAPTMLTGDLMAGSLTVNTDMERARVAPDDAPPNDQASLNYETNDTFTGTYRGIAGTYTCTGTCTVTLDDGEVTVTGELSFVPTNQAATYDAPDMDYAYFGWWLKKPEKEDAVHIVEVFSGAMGNVFPAENVEALEGSADYVGPAAGKFAAKSYTAGALQDAQAGHFTATATLTANFDADATPDTVDNDGLGMISGMVRDFTASDGIDASDWEVTLGETPLSATEVTFNGETSVDFGGGDVDSAGRWQGSFYNNTDADATDDAPGTVAGTFDAVTQGAAVIGGFGATLQ